MTFEEAKEIFLNRGWISVDNRTFFDGEKWRESVTVISKCLYQKQVIVINNKKYRLEKPVLKAVDKNGYFTFYGFKEVT